MLLGQPLGFGHGLLDGFGDELNQFPAVALDLFQLLAKLPAEGLDRLRRLGRQRSIARRQQANGFRRRKHPAQVAETTRRPGRVDQIPVDVHQLQARVLDVGGVGAGGAVEGLFRVRPGFDRLRLPRDRHDQCVDAVAQTEFAQLVFPLLYLLLHLVNRLPELAYVLPHLPLLLLLLVAGDLLDLFRLGLGTLDLLAHDLLFLLRQLGKRLLAQIDLALPEIFEKIEQRHDDQGRRERGEPADVHGLEAGKFHG